MMLLDRESCPVCGSQFICELQRIYLQRQRSFARQYFCMECRSFYHRSGYKEDAKQLKVDLAWLVAHPADFSDSISFLKRLFPNAKTCFEAGCGTGDLLHQLTKAGFDASGIDPNGEVVSFAIKTFGVDARKGYFEKGIAKADLIFCIDVMEHLVDPRTFFEAMVSSLNEGGAIAVRVPHLETNRWHYLRGVDKKRQFDLDDPFCDNSVHITHFSLDGLFKMARQLGLLFATHVPDGIVAFSAFDPSAQAASNAPDVDKATPNSDQVRHYVNETCTRLVYQRVLKRGDHALDVGANRGDHTVAMAAIVSELGLVHAFEPNPALFLRLLSIPNVRLWPFAASDKKDAVSFYIPEGLDGWASLRDLHAELPEHLITKIMTLCAPIDAFLAEIQPSRVRFVKIDVELHEEQAIKGMSELISRSRAVVVLENPTRQIDEYLCRLGYSVFAFDGTGWMESELCLPNVVAIPNERRAVLSQILPSADELSRTFHEAETAAGG